MKVKLEFDDDEQEEARTAFQGAMYQTALHGVWEKCFRPNNKHGYGNKLLDSEESYEVIEELIKLFQEATEGLDVY